MIVIHIAGRQAGTHFAWGKSKRCERVSDDQGLTILQAQHRITGVWPGAWITRGRPGTSRTSSSLKLDASATGAERATPLLMKCRTRRKTGGSHTGNVGGLPLLRMAAASRAQTRRRPPVLGGAQHCPCGQDGDG